jgi:hypothetical protein
MGSPGQYSQPVFLKNGRPLASAPIPGGNTIARTSFARQAGSSGSGLAESFALMAKPDTRQLLSNVVNLERGGASALRPAQAAAQVAARRTATQILMSRVTLSGARPLAAEALQVAGRASAAVGGALSRTPVVGTVIRRLAPFVPKGPGLGVLIALQVVPDVMEAFAPDVHSWLLGGWKGDGKGKGTLGYPAAIVGTVNGAQYHLRATSYSTNTELESNPVSIMDIILTGPVSFVEIKEESLFWSVRLNKYIVRYAPRWVDRQGLEYRVLNYYKGEPANSLSWTLTRVDGTDETIPKYQDAVIARSSIVQNPTATAPTQAKPGTDRADAVRDAALLAAIATIAAGKYSPAPKVNKNPTKNPERKVGILPSASPTTPQPSSTPCKGNGCGQAGLDATKGVDSKLDDLLQYLQTLGLADTNKIVRRIDEKVGAQIFDDRGNKTGLAGAAIETFKKVNKVGDYLRFDRITNVLTLAATVHNAAMLSNSLEQTLVLCHSSNDG